MFVFVFFCLLGGGGGRGVTAVGRLRVPQGPWAIALGSDSDRTSLRGPWPGRGVEGSRGFKRVQEGSKGFKSVQEGSRGFKRVQEV